ncbi:hypothetical protein [Alicyclobacillus macrosporangiidus]|uniref:hypothetical protein n=1 Tax=Alicyclobacillus macrosporangiidus TaxID=392015 RepID=UPI000496738A|nr:hypothetical protein [Alicyclobacillus macrosporangiidus]
MALTGKAKMAALVGAAAGFLTAAGVFGVYAFADSTGNSTASGQSQQTGPQANGPRGGWAAPGGLMIGQWMPQLAQYFGISEDELRQQLASGKSLNDIAAAQGKQSDLQNELKTLVHDALQKKVQAGRLTADQASQMEQKIDAQLPNLAADTHLRLWHGKRVMFGADLLQLAAKDLNMTVAELRKDLASGQSIADVATAKHVDVNQLTSELQQAVDQKVNQGIQKFINQKGLFGHKPGPQPEGSSGQAQDGSGSAGSTGSGSASGSTSQGNA